MIIKLNRLTMENFKGIRNLTLEPQGEDLVVRGKNATGKTTLSDSVQYLLFGKDSQGKSDFAIKTLGDDGQEIHGLDHSVEAELDVDGQVVTLKKVYKEKWTKRRGSTNKELTGHTTEHYIDGVPCKKSDWDARINSLIDESTFKLLTSPTYFNTQLHWEKRRQILLQVCGDVADQDVIDSNADLAKLPDVLGNRSLEDHKKVVAARRKEINKRLEQLPARIDELSRSTQAVDQYSPKMIKDKIKELEQKIDGTKASDGKAELYRQESELEAELSKLQRENEQALQKQKNEAQDSLDQISRERKREKEIMDSAKANLAERRQTHGRLVEQLENLRTDYKEVAAQEFSDESICPTCGQNLPEDQVQAAKDKFNQKKASKLRDINTYGKQLKAEVERTAEQIESYGKDIAQIEAELADLDQQFEAKVKELEQAKNQPGPHDDRILEIQDKIYQLDEQLKEAGTQADTSGLEQELEAERTKLAQVDAAKQSKARIEELKAEEKKLAQEYEDLESQTYLMEQFVVSKVNMLENKINSKFALARFKLFEEQINGGISETCQTLYQGVPYGSGLNNGARINVGLDIIRTLSEHYGIKAPVFVDNAESITDLINPGTQTIKLVVDGRYPELTIDSQEASDE